MANVASLRFGQGFDDGVVERVRALRRAGHVVDFGALPDGHLGRERVDDGAGIARVTERDPGRGDPAASNDHGGLDVAVPRGAPAGVGAVFVLRRRRRRSKRRGVIRRRDGGDSERRGRGGCQRWVPARYRPPEPARQEEPPSETRRLERWSRVMVPAALTATPVETALPGAVEGACAGPVEIRETSAGAPAGTAEPAAAAGGTAWMTAGTAGRRRTGSSANRSAAARVRT